MSTGEQSLFFLFNVNSPSTGIRFYFWQIKSLFHGPTFWLQKTESGCIVLSEKNSGNRSCTFANNEIVNNSSMSCCKMMKKAAIPSFVITNLIVLKTKITYIQTKNSMKVPIVWLWHGKAMTGKWVIRVCMQQRTGYILCAEKSGLELFYQFRPQGFLKMADDRTGSVRDVCLEVLCQSMPIDERFLCGYRLIIDWPIPVDTN